MRKGLLVLSNKIQGKPYRTIHITSTHYKFVTPCMDCGKDGGIISGVPTEVDITLPMTVEEHMSASDKMFYVGVDFDIRCNNGFSHSAIGIKKGTDNFYVSDTPGYHKGYYEVGESLEKALYKFIPFLLTADRPNRLEGKF